MVNYMMRNRLSTHCNANPLISRTIQTYIDGIHAESEGAHLRWFILSDALRDQGLGNRLIDTAIDFCRRSGYPKIYLWTFEGLHAARHLYEKAGFRLVKEHNGTQWGTKVNEQRFELLLKDRA